MRLAAQTPEYLLLAPTQHAELLAQMFSERSRSKPKAAS